AGYTTITLPSCVTCGRARSHLVPGPDGRVCGACDARSRHRACARCGNVGRILAIRDEGGICHRCYRVDEAVIQPCGTCGRRGLPARRLPDGTPLCDRCSSTPRTCTSCGTTAVTHYRGPSGPVCPTCYREQRQPRRACSKCGRTSRVASRAGA